MACLQTVFEPYGLYGIWLQHTSANLRMPTHDNIQITDQPVCSPYNLVFLLHFGLSLSRPTNLFTMAHTRMHKPNTCCTFSGMKTKYTAQKPSCVMHRNVCTMSLQRQTHKNTADNMNSEHTVTNDGTHLSSPQLLHVRTRASHALTCRALAAD